MIFKYKKYKDVAAFVNNQPKTGIDNEFTIVNKCNGVCFNGQISFTDKCFACLFCASDGKVINEKFFEYWGYGTFEKIASTAFKGKPVELPKAKLLIKNRNFNLEAFTSYDETTNIQPWAAAILNITCSKANRISMEVPIFNLAYDRNGRLDICCITDGHLMAMESKTSLDDALKDERFIEQRYKYVNEIEKATKAYSYLTLIGGKETDFYPEDDGNCSGRIGNKASRFYTMIKKNNIKFISVAALWSMACKYFAGDNDFCWDKFLVKVFSDPNCVGLLSAGKVIAYNDRFIIEKI